MRTTIELSEFQRAELLKLAAQRGEKGFSKIIGEALEHYLKSEALKNSKVQKALKLRGSFKGEGAILFEKSILGLRRNWR